MKQSDFLNIVMPFKDKVFRLSKRLLVSTEEAEDATQELLLKLWNNRAKISSYKNVEAFAMTMTKNYCFDRLKSKQASNLSLVHSNYREKGTSLERKTDLNDSVSIVHRLIAKLPEQQRLIIQLRDVEQYEYEEISKMLEIKPTAVRVALSRTRKTIREQLIKQHNYGIKQN
jgi:RNA polymerase sigma-70 factor (ECF subfamily)